jgi:hypothetical protein
LVFAIALAAGGVGALLAVVLQHVAVGLAGFVAGGYVAWNLVDMLGWELGQRSLGAWEPWLVFVGGGRVFAALIGVLFEWALIVLSSITGGLLTVQGLPLPSGIQVALFAFLAAVGIVVQAVLYRMERSRPTSNPRWRQSTWR